MIVLAITDIPRMTALLERLAHQQAGLTVVSEIHRGGEELEAGGPELVIFQNHLAGLSADILLKHLTTKAGSKIPRFALISSPESVDADTAARFETCVDPSQNDETLEQQLRTLLQCSTTAADNLPPATAHQLPELSPQPDAQQATIPLLPETTPELEEPALVAADTYQPQRSGRSIRSDFSRQLDTNTDTFTPEPEQDAATQWENKQPSELITEVGASSSPWYRKPVAGLVAITLLAVVGTTLYQHRPATSPAKPVPTVPPVVQKPLSSLPPTAMAAISSARQTVGTPQTARTLRRLPAFIPQEGHSPAYGIRHPGWEQYRGQTNEYRVFRAKNNVIKAIQVIDRSGGGIQESLYNAALQELTGSTGSGAVQTDIKEGYEIRRSSIAGLQLVQYRDAQGGRLRGFVVTWP